MANTKDGFNMHRGFAVGQEIRDFVKGSWQEAEHERGRRFYEPVAPASRMSEAATPHKAVEDVYLGHAAVAHLVEPTPNHQEIATLEDKLQEVRAANPGDSRHLVRVDAA